MTDLLREVGEALYGPRWQTDLARDLDVADRTVRRWAAGDFQMAAGVWDDLEVMLHDRGLEIDRLRTAVKDFAEGRARPPQTQKRARPGGSQSGQV